MYPNCFNFPVLGNNKTLKFLEINITNEHIFNSIISVFLTGEYAITKQKIHINFNVKDLRPIISSSALLTTARQYTSSLCKSLVGLIYLEDVADTNSITTAKRKEDKK